MNILRKQLANKEHTVGWLELFFDLVYVATIIALGNWLSHDYTVAGIAGFVLLFTTVWSSWVGTVFFMNRFDQNDIGQHLLVFLQMYFVVGLAVHMSDPLGDLARGYAISFAMVIFARILMYARAWGTFKEARPLIKRFILGDVPLVLIWLVSTFLAPPYNYLLWIGSVIWGISIPLLPRIRKWGERMRPDMHHLSERVGLFTIIVLGEAFSKVVGSSLVAGHHPLGLESVLSMLIVACLWWVYFNHASATSVGESPRTRFLWFFAHLPLAIGVTAMGVAIKTTVVGSAHPDPGSGWLLLGSMAVCWLILALIEIVTRPNQPLPRTTLMVGRAAGAFVLIGAGVWFPRISAAWLLILVSLTAVVQVALDVVWRAKLAQHLVASE
ncbi:MAG: low temperature requirement protein A [Anaerolineales bacterium]|jgi:low temperature requirement protein LtrA